MPKPKTNKQLLEETLAKLEDLTAIKTTVDEIHEAVYGDGNPEKGLWIRVRDLEIFHKIVRRIMWIAVGAAVTSIVVAVLATRFGT